MQWLFAYIGGTRAAERGDSVNKVLGNLVADAHTFKELLYQIAVRFAGVLAQRKDGGALANEHRRVRHDADDASLRRQCSFHRLQCDACSD